MRPLELSEKRFGKLVAIKRHHTKTPDGKWNWVCLCDCGTRAIITGKRLKDGTTKSCGCLRAETAHKNQDHLPKGMYRSRTHNSWRAIFDRCFNVNNAAYHLYGGRGITVCGRWRKFSAFLSDMGERPVGTSLDRYPNYNGNYEPSNCRWATPKQQANNRRARRHGYKIAVKYRRSALCAACQSDFTARSPKAIYCSGACKAAAFRMRM